ncbi:hypothetical protein Q8A67_024155 [Cirrhinus molitorella]|uniref:Uncharacterized protein n=1 Tax=Cirrhinus molitorella TaxID=172907 RepID=A0AA88TBI2_9TELE|nr:hypothetical protein Q8A67_024155 [Cirrhinus molitorella]
MALRRSGSLLHRGSVKSSDEGRLLRNSSNFRPQALVTLNDFPNLATPKLTEQSKQTELVSDDEKRLTVS